MRGAEELRSRSGSAPEHELVLDPGSSSGPDHIWFSSVLVEDLQVLVLVDQQATRV